MKTRRQREEIKERSQRKEEKERNEEAGRKEMREALLRPLLTASWQPFAV
jgi:hypothetical protein